ncbi:MAG: hypothetical protein ABI051_09645 [Vicinamibacterales bacterium]
MTPARVHLDVLGWLHVLWGLFGLLAGVSLGILALGTTAAFFELRGDRGGMVPAAWILLIGGVLLLAGGASMVAAGRALLSRSRRGRLAVLLLAVPNLFLLPFGTALGVYSFWALLNDDARREFGRPPRVATA